MNKIENKSIEPRIWVDKRYPNHLNYPGSVEPFFLKNKNLPYYLAIITQIIVQIWLIIVSLILLGNNWILGFSVYGLCFPGAIIAFTTFFLSLSYIEKFWDKWYAVCSISILIGMIIAISSLLYVLIIP